MRVCPPRALIAVLTLLSLHPALAQPSDDAFRQRASTYARSQSLTLDWVSQAQLDEDAAPEALARLCTGDYPDGALYLVELDPGVLWTASTQSGGGNGCPSASAEHPPASPQSPRTSLTLALDEDRSHASAEVAFRGGAPVLLRASSGSASSGAEIGSHSMEEDWRTLTFSETASSFGTGEEGQERTTRLGGALIPVLASLEEARELPPTFNAVVHGRGAWTGAQDAALRVAAVAAREGGARLRIDVTDDTPVEAPGEVDDAAFLKVDHLEVWFVATLPDAVEPTAIQFGVARTSAGGLLTRWLHPRNVGLPLPSVTLEERTVVVELSPELLGTVPSAIADWTEGQLTVAFSDTDAPGAGQQSLVATSLLRWNVPATFGRVVDFKGHTRFPSPGYLLANLPAGSAVERLVEPPLQQESRGTDAVPTAEPRRARPEWVDTLAQAPRSPFIAASIVLSLAAALAARFAASRVLLGLGVFFAAAQLAVEWVAAEVSDRHFSLAKVLTAGGLGLAAMVVLPWLALRVTRAPGARRVVVALVLPTVIILYAVLKT